MAIDKKNLRKKLIIIALPIIAQQLVHYIQIMTDALLLGRVNPGYLSALGNVLSPYFTMLAFLFAASSGVTVLVAHGHGSSRNKSNARISEVSLFFTTLVSLFFFIIWFFAGKTILSAMGASGIILAQGQQYVQILSFSLILFGIELSLMSTLQGIGITSPIMISGIIRNVVNIILDIILINGHLGFPKMGIQGAALATTIANVFSAIYLMFYFNLSKKIPFHLRIGSIIKPRWRVYRHVVTIGFPSGLEFMLFNFGQLAIVRMLNTIDGMAVGVFTLIKHVQFAALFIYIGIARATLTLVGQQLGAKNKSAAIFVTRSAIRISLVISMLAAFIFITGPEWILQQFTSSDPLFVPFKISGILEWRSVIIERGMPLMWIIAFTLFPQTINVIVGHAIRGMKDTRWMLYTQIGGTIFAIISAIIGIFSFQAGLAFIFIIYFADETIRAGINYLRFHYGRRFLQHFFSKKNINNQESM